MLRLATATPNPMTQFPALVTDCQVHTLQLSTALSSRFSWRIQAQGAWLVLPGNLRPPWQRSVPSYACPVLSRHSRRLSCVKMAVCWRLSWKPPTIDFQADSLNSEQRLPMHLSLASQLRFLPGYAWQGQRFVCLWVTVQHWWRSTGWDFFADRYSKSSYSAHLCRYYDTVTAM